jgi:effector-binding domain-containing protein
MARFDLDLDNPDDADYEVAVPLPVEADAALPKKIGQVRTGTLPAHSALVITHTGPYEEIIAGYTAITEELNSLGYAVTGPASEVYLVGADSGADPADYITEIRVPVAL